MIAPESVSQSNEAIFTVHSLIKIKKKEDQGLHKTLRLLLDPLLKDDGLCFWSLDKITAQVR